MPPRDPNLPEGTDHIIDTNIDVGDTGGGSGPSGGGTGGGSRPSGGGTGGTGGTSNSSASTGATTATGGASGSSGTGGSTTTGGTGGSTSGSAFQFDKAGDSGSAKGGVGKVAETITGQVKEQISTLTSQAGDKARTFADDGKRQTTDFLQTIAKVVADAAGSVEERLGGQYAGVGRKASDSINSLASSLDERSVDDLIEDARSFVTRSPAIAIGIAAVVGFAIARVARSSIAEFTSGDQDSTGTTGGTTAGGGTGSSVEAGNASTS